jgi:cytochrome c oxidase subunit 4
MSHEVVQPKAYFFNAIALGVLMALTVAVAYVDLHAFFHVALPLNAIVAMTIAITKAVLIILIFMDVRHNTRLTWIFVAGGFFWLLILLLLILPDFLSRDWVRRAEPWPQPIPIVTIDHPVAPGATHDSPH